MKSVRVWVFSGLYFSAFGLNTDIYSVNLRIQFKCGKTWTRNISECGHIPSSEKSLGKKTKKKHEKEKRKKDLQCFVCVLLLSPMSVLYRPLPF